MDTKSIEKLKNSAIRREWNDAASEWYFSIVDSVGIVANSSDARNYWKVLKSRLKASHHELVTNCNQLKMKASDGKFYLTDVGNRDTVLKIIEIISSDEVPSFIRYFDGLDQKKNIKIISIREPLGPIYSDQKSGYPQDNRKRIRMKSI